MKSLEPVQGWKAEKTWCDGGWTYHVIKCPNFVQMKTVAKKKRVGVGRSGTKVRIIETGEVFKSIRDCAKAINVSESYVSQCLQGKFKSVYGFHFEKVGR